MYKKYFKALILIRKMKMGIRKGKNSDIDDIMSIKNAVVILMKESGNNQWSESYPARDTLLNDIENENLYIYEEDGKVLGFIVADNHHAYEYDDIPWELARLDSIAFHRAAVDPRAQGKGIASKLFDEVEAHFKNEGYLGVHTDTNLNNLPMQSLFEKRGYEYRGKLNLHNNLNEWYVAYEKVF